MWTLKITNGDNGDNEDILSLYDHNTWSNNTIII